MRTVMVVAVVVSCVVVAGAAEDWSAYKPQIEALLADEVTVGFELASTWSAQDLRPDDPWPDPGVRRLDIGKSSAYGQGYAVIDTNTQQVIGLVVVVQATGVYLGCLLGEEGSHDGLAHAVGVLLAPALGEAHEGPQAVAVPLDRLRTETSK